MIASPKASDQLAYHALDDRRATVTNHHRATLRPPQREAASMIIVLSSGIEPL